MAKKSISFAGDEHSLDVRHDDCLDDRDGSITWRFTFEILGNYAHLTEKDAKRLMEWIKTRLWDKAS